MKKIKGICIVLLSLFILINFVACVSETPNLPDDMSTPLPDGDIGDVDFEKLGQRGIEITIVYEDSSFCTISLGMMKSEVLGLLDKAGIAVRDRGEHDIYDVFYNNMYSFDFRENIFGEKVLHSFNTNHSDISTEQGIKIGDSEEKIEKTYGSYDDLNVDNEGNGKTYSYYFEGYHLNIFTGYENEAIARDITLQDEKSQYVFGWTLCLD